ncbi:hypothetical protein [Rhizorhabdus sp.]|uniref:hypothetical protein n=1 Tax=Rhizorhabdus sp. TaxID=1968843 RepID=UPI0035B087B2
MSDEPGTVAGMRAAIDEAGPLLPLRDAEQLDMLAEESGSTSVNRVHAELAPRATGRPRGARNRRTEEVRSYLLSRYAHPLEVLAQVYSRPVDALAAELHCSRADAMALQVKAAAEVAPYIEGKQPVAISITRKHDVVLVMPREGETVQQLGERINADGVDGIDWDAATIEGEILSVQPLGAPLLGKSE